MSRGDGLFRFIDEKPTTRIHLRREYAERKAFERMAQSESVQYLLIGIQNIQRRRHYIGALLPGRVAEHQHKVPEPFASIGYIG
jgi:hypothetical protein